MPMQWRGRSAALAVAIPFLAVAAVAGGAGLARADPALNVIRSDGSVVERVSLPADRSFTLRYRNSLYGTLAEERFVIDESGSIELVELGAEQLAVLEEYYAVDEPAAQADDGAWSATPAHAPRTTSLRVAATELGQRTLIVDGQDPIELWQLVQDADPTIILELDR